jgi:hypothetical protein
MEQLSNLFSHQVSEADFISNLKENQGSFMLAVDHFNNVLLLHQVSILGPSMFQPEQFILVLGGVGAAASCFRIHPSSFSNLVEETLCPTWSHLKGATNKTEVQDHIVPADACNKVKSRRVVVVPPLVALVVLAAPTQDAADIIPLLIDAFKIFDQASEHIKACTVLCHVIFFSPEENSPHRDGFRFFTNRLILGSSITCCLHYHPKPNQPIHHYKHSYKPST